MLSIYWLKFVAFGMHMLKSGRPQFFPMLLIYYIKGWLNVDSYTVYFNYISLYY